MFKQIFVLVFCAAIVLAAPPKKGGGLKGSREHHKAEVKKAIADDLSTIKDQKQLDEFVAAGLLVPLPANESIEIDKRVPANRRYCRSWTRDFLLNIGRNFKTEFNKRIKVTSGVRTLADQKDLRKHNRNASPTSTHPMGATVDISWKGWNSKKVAWFGGQLLALQKAGKIVATQERGQACFHILVLKKYSETAAKKPQVKKVPAKKALRKGR